MSIRRPTRAKFLTVVLVVLAILTAAIALCNAGPPKVRASGSTWTRAWMGSDVSLCSGLAIDTSGAAYLCGYYKGVLDLNPGWAWSMVAANDKCAGFLLKLDSNGHFVWGKADPNTEFRDIALGADDRVIACGDFKHTARISSGASGAMELEKSGQAMIARLGELGEYRWSSLWGLTGYADATSIGIDSEQNVYVAGSFHGIMDFDPGEEAWVLSSDGCKKAYVTAFNAENQFIWAVPLGKQAFDTIGLDIIATPTGDIVLAGRSSPVGGTPNQREHLFVSVIGRDGSPTWFSDWQFDGLLICGPHITAGSENNIYIVGSYTGSLQFGSDPDSGVRGVTRGPSDIYLLSLDLRGNLRWFHTFGGTGEDCGGAIAMDSSKAIYVGGGASEDVDFNPGPESWGAHFPRRVGARPFWMGAFVSVFDSDGDLQLGWWDPSLFCVTGAVVSQSGESWITAEVTRGWALAHFGTPMRPACK